MDSDFILIATPTDYNSDNNYFDTTLIEKVLEEIIKVGTNALIVIKSTVPVGYTKAIADKYNLDNLIFLYLNFLREGKALYDNLFPSRIIVSMCNLEIIFMEPILIMLSRTLIKILL